LCLFFGIAVLLNVKKHSSGRTTFQGEDHGNQPEQFSIPVETPGPALFHDIDARLVMAVEKFVRYLALGSFISEFKGG
jgi:hypothetical protein